RSAPPVGAAPPAAIKAAVAASPTAPTASRARRAVARPSAAGGRARGRARLRDRPLEDGLAGPLDDDVALLERLLDRRADRGHGSDRDVDELNPRQHRDDRRRDGEAVLVGPALIGGERRERVALARRQKEPDHIGLTRWRRLQPVEPHVHERLLPVREPEGDGAAAAGAALRLKLHAGQGLRLSGGRRRRRAARARARAERARDGEDDDDQEDGGASETDDQLRLAFGESGPRLGGSARRGRVGGARPAKALGKREARDRKSRQPTRAGAALLAREPRKLAL